MKKLIRVIFGLLMINMCGLYTFVGAAKKENNLCLYVMSSSNKKFNEWRKAVIMDISKYYQVIVISNGELDDRCDSAYKIIKRQNKGYDFGAWKEYIIKNYDYIKKFDNLLIANDSFYRVSSLDMAIEKGINGKFQLYGMKYGREKRFLE